MRRSISKRGSRERKGHGVRLSRQAAVSQGGCKDDGVRDTCVPSLGLSNNNRSLNKSIIINSNDGLFAAITHYVVKNT